MNCLCSNEHSPPQALPAERTCYTNMVIIFWFDNGFDHCNQPLDQKSNLQFPHFNIRHSARLRDNQHDTTTNSGRTLVYLLMRSCCNLCHDSSGTEWFIHSACVGKICFHYRSIEESIFTGKYPNSSDFPCRVRNRNFSIFKDSALLSDALA